jgi:hypothetical protein
VLSEPLLAEYRAVLLRPRLAALHRLSPAEMDTILTDLAQHAIVLTPDPTGAARTPAPDPGDPMLRDLLGVRPDLRLVTGDKRLLDDPGMQGRVLSPQGVRGSVMVQWERDASSTSTSCSNLCPAKGPAARRPRCGRLPWCGPACRRGPGRWTSAVAAACPR